jgi:predicted DNA-binding transcriptional regulator YafY
MRLLAFLELLQDVPVLTGAEAARRLGVDGRTVRRYVEGLQVLGIPVEGQRGVGGGYRLRPGSRLPPLMLDDDEATAVVAGLIATRRMDLPGVDPALAKVRRVLPATARRRVEALESTLTFAGPRVPVAAAPMGETLLTLADAARRRRRVRATYLPPSGSSRDRELDPFGVVVHGGRWYLSARAAESGETRTFRVDRLADVTLGAAASPPAEDFDVVAAVARSLARVPYAYGVVVRLEATPEAIRARIPATIAELEADGEATVLRMRADSLSWVAGLLASLGCPFAILEPDALRAHVRELATSLVASATA